jgi:hypothetical protein
LILFDFLFVLGAGFDLASSCVMMGAACPFGHDKV